MATSFGFTAAQRLVPPEHLAELAKRTERNSLPRIADRSLSFEQGIRREFLPSGLIRGRTLLGWRLQEFRACWRPCLERIGPAKELVDTPAADSLARDLSRLLVLPHACFVARLLVAGRSKEWVSPRSARPRHVENLRNHSPSAPCCRRDYFINRLLLLSFPRGPP